MHASHHVASLPRWDWRGHTETWETGSCENKQRGGDANYHSPWSVAFYLHPSCSRGKHVTALPSVCVCRLRKRLRWMTLFLCTGFLGPPVTLPGVSACPLETQITKSGQTNGWHCVSPPPLKGNRSALNRSSSSRASLDGKSPPGPWWARLICIWTRL